MVHDHVHHLAAGRRAVVALVAVNHGVPGQRHSCLLLLFSGGETWLAGPV